MHLVALYKGFIILQVCARGSDVGPDIFIQVPGMIPTVIISQILLIIKVQKCLFLASTPQAALYCVFGQYEQIPKQHFHGKVL